MSETGARRWHETASSETMDERATHDAPGDPRFNAAQSGPPSAPHEEGNAGTSLEEQSVTPRPMTASGSSVGQQRADRAGGTSKTRAFAAVASDEAIVAHDIGSGSTSRRLQPRPPPRVDTQPTVISKQSPAAITPPVGHLHPMEMGRVLLGQRLGHYELIEFVGGGGMGAVFRALDTMLNRTVAVKVLSHDQSNDEETLRRFKNEAQSAARLDHENIGRVHYVGEDGGWHYIVFEFIEGINLRDLVDRDGRLPLAEAVSYMLQLGDALAHAARRDVVHRDIKPSNVLITPEGKAKLVDMGLARLHQVEHANNDLTASGVTLGTFDYISPEQARDPRSADVRSDLYSLGCTFYFMLTARPPFPEGTVLQKLLQHQADDPPDPRQFCADLPDDLHRILRRLLAKSPDDRYQTPLELVAELTIAAVRLGLRPASPGSMVWLATAPPTPRHWQRALPWLAPIVALVAIVILLNVFWSPPGDITPTLLKRPRGDSPAANKATASAESPADITAKRDKSKPDRKGGKDAREREPAADVASADPTAQQRDTKSTMPWIDSTVPAYRQAVTLVWDKVHSEDLPSRLTSARQNWGLPFDIDLRGQRTPAASGSRTAAPGERIVAGRFATGAEYASLSAAIRDAKSGDVILLRYNGALVEPPLDIGNLRLTIRAERDYAPVVKFLPDDDDLVAERRSMINLDNGLLALRDVHFDFALPAGTTDHWSLFELGHAEALRFDACTVTVRNIDEGFDRPTASVIHMRAGLADGTGMMKDTLPSFKSVQIETHDSVFRGATTFLKLARGRSVEWAANNVLLALGERMLDADVGLMSGRGASTTVIDLQHATVLAQFGIMRLINEGASSVMPVEVECHDSILSSGRDFAIGIVPMMEQIGDESAEAMQEHFNWHGERSLYDGFSVAWRGQSGGRPQEVSFAQWKSMRGVRDNPLVGRSIWARLPQITGRALHDYLPGDFALRLNSVGIGAAANGSDIGAALDLLPLLPTPVQSGRQ